LPVATVRRLIRCVTILARDGRLPKPLRAAAAVGLLPLPGPLDELVLLLVGIPLVLFYRPVLRDAWQKSCIAAEFVMPEMEPTKATLPVAASDSHCACLRSASVTAHNGVTLPPTARLIRSRARSADGWP
jgi:hypothetical protein